MSDGSRFSVWGFIKGFGKLIIGVLLLLQGLIGLVVLMLAVGVMVSVMNGVAGNAEAPEIGIPEDSALVLNPSGVLVEYVAEIDPFEAIIEEAYGVQDPPQVAVHDLVRVVRAAKDDDRIKGMVLDLGNLGISSSSASKAHYLADEIAKFGESGKKVIAIGDYYSQSQYLLAASADEIHMNDYGNVVLTGYGRYGLYFKTFLEKLKITTHVFRVGTFKSAVEPFLRDDMSEAAKEANQAYLGVLWREYAASVEKARGLEAGSVDYYANNLGEIMRSVDGDMAQAAVEAGFVDKLLSRAEQRDVLIAEFGADENEKSFKQVNYRKYMDSLNGNEDGDAPNVAVITAAGTIVDGQAPLGEAAGGDTIAALLRKAREDEDVKAVVLRVDSPGGSAFASDVIRDEVLAIKAAGKPVVASMGSLAASGGYWISAPADEIWAAPTTITGSIGIFGVFNTFENAAAHWGLNVDGVGTTNLSAFDATGLGPLPETAADIFQQSIEHGYTRFLEIVSEGRDLETDYIDTIAQGRVWIGETATELKLVDKIGGLDQAIEAAAKLAELEDYDVVDLVERKTPFEQLIEGFSMKVAEQLGADRIASARRAPVVAQILNQVEEQAEFFAEFNDPNAVYARCLACE